LSGQIDIEEKTRLPERIRRADYSFRMMANRKAFMTDAEINALAKEILTKTLLEVNKVAPQVLRIERKSNGDPFMEFVGTSKLGLGGFRCQYDPLPSIKQLIIESEKLYDDFAVTITDKQTKKTTTEILGESPSEDRNGIIGSMAHVAALMMVGAFYPKLCELLGDGFQEAKIIAEGVLKTTVASQLDTDEIIGYADTDMSLTVDQAVKKVAERKEKYLRDYLSTLPHVIAKRGPGRLAKSKFHANLEAIDYAAKVERVYRTLRVEKGRPPTKVSVAGELGEGGINPRGGDSRLNAFNLKLGRLGVNYEEIAEKVEADLHSKS
jgi:hypothetical protein